MNNSNPLLPQSSLLDQKNKGRNRVRLAVFVVLSIHVVGLMALLMAGCHQAGNEPGSGTNGIVPSTMDTNPAVMGTNPPVPTPVTPIVVTNPLPAPPAVAQDYKVVKGDNYTSIAKKFGVSVKALEAANPGVEPTKLIADKTILHIPAPTVTPPPTGILPTGSGTGLEQTYKVQTGDNLTKLATKFGTSVKAIQAANNLGSSTRIKVGDTLKIPAKAAVPVETAPTSAPATPPPASTPPPITH